VPAFWSVLGRPGWFESRPWCRVQWVSDTHTDKDTHIWYYGDCLFDNRKWETL